MELYYNTHRYYYKHSIPNEAPLRPQRGYMFVKTEYKKV